MLWHELLRLQLPREVSNGRRSSPSQKVQLLTLTQVTRVSNECFVTEGAVSTAAKAAATLQ